VEVVVHRCGCRSWACPRCSVGLGSDWRRRLVARWGPWVEYAVMITLTLDRSRFSCPEDARRFVLRNRSVSRAMSRFGLEMGLEVRGRYAVKFELQRGGWPHWHVLLMVDAGVELGRNDFASAWPYGFSMVSRGAGGYLAKYAAGRGSECQERLEASGLPARGVRWMTASRGFWGSGRGGGRVVESEAVPSDAGELLSVRVECCGLDSVLEIREAGREKPEWCMVPVSREELLVELVGPRPEVNCGEHVGQVRCERASLERALRVFGFSLEDVRRGCSEW